MSNSKMKYSDFRTKIPSKLLCGQRLLLVFLWSYVLTLLKAKWGDIPTLEMK